MYIDFLCRLMQGCVCAAFECTCRRHDQLPTALTAANAGYIM